MALAEQIAVNPCLDTNVPLGIDEACFSVMNKYDIPVTLFSYLAECYMCSVKVPTATLAANKNTTLVVSTKYPLHVFYKIDHEYCHTTYHFKERGSYGWNISQNNDCSHIYTIHEPINSFLPIFVSFMVFMLLWILFVMGNVIVRVIKRKLSRDSVHDDLDRLQESETANPVIMTSRISIRIRSLDAFRGIAILLMIFVNNGGGEYVFFKHSAWNGLTVADLVLPWFAWIMGMSITVSKRSELRVSNARGKIILRCLQRAFILILLGLIVNSIDTKSLNDLRFPGVLQMMAVSYFVCATIEIIFMKAHSQGDFVQFRQFTVLRDILDNWAQWAIILAIMTTHTLITFLLPVPNCPTGYLGPGGYHDFGKDENCTGGAAGYIDRLVFGSHMYNKTNPVYGTILPHDPEGIMNTVSIILVVYMGVHAGKILLLSYQCNARMVRWLMWSGFTGLIAGILCYFDKESGVIPVSKKMMSLSFVLTVSCFAFLLYAILHYFIDYKQYWSGAPFIYAGLNPITLYIGHMITKGLFPWAWKLAHATHWSLLAMNLWTTTLWGIIAYWLYLKDVIVSI